MSQVRLILALHNHQPVGNFDGVFEEAYRTAYLPFLDVLEGYPEIPFVLHTSGPLLEWLVERKPDYIDRLRRMVAAGRVEILGGGFFEPILTMIPHRDRVGQIRGYSRYLEETLGARVRGIWIAERVWEQHLVTSIAEAGIEYTILDDAHFLRAGCAAGDVLGYYLTEDDGRLLKVFPGSEALRYSIPFREPHQTYEFLRRLAERRPGATVVFADDGEKLGSWPETYEHVYKKGWLNRFCDMLLGNRDWLETTTLSRAVDATLPEGQVYLPDGSYREMTEWALTPDASAAYRRAARRIEALEDGGEVARFFRPGGFWRNFKAKYTECGEMYTRMLTVSRRLAALEDVGSADPDYIDVARQELYRGQCNCPYWHGSFGGLYLPHLRNAIYRSLIAADNALDHAEGRTGPRVALEVADFNLDARQEIRLENDHLIAFVRPAQGGHLYELDARRATTNLLSTLDRRPEPYHDAIREATGRQGDGQGTESPHQSAADGSGSISLKQHGLEELLVYDGHPRKALVDHFYTVDATLDDLIAGREVECGDFAEGAYLARIQRESRRVAAILERPGRVGGHTIRIRKTIELRAGSPDLAVSYVLENLPRDECLHFAVEINLAAMAGHATDRYYTDPSGARLGLLDARLDLPHTSGLTLTDEWLDLSVALGWSQAAGLWCFPIRTVSRSEGGIEGVYQSSAIVPHWHITADEEGRWEVHLRCHLGQVAAVRGANGVPGEMLAQALS
jgi:alpha-amylase